MGRVRSLTRALALAGAAFVAAPGHHRAWAAPLGQQMPGMPRGAMSMGVRNMVNPSDTAASALGITGAQHITLYVLPGGNGLGFTGPDKGHHDTLVPSSFVLRKGVPVTFTVINLDDMRHSITAPQLGVNVIIKPGIDRGDGGVAPTTTTYTFIPAKAGEFRWFCVFPCDMPTHWAMSASYDGPDRDGFMAGIIRVL
jgi:heme/copper-type cytochrome/quinol oxidase subunit 2